MKKSLLLSFLLLFLSITLSVNSSIINTVTAEDETYWGSLISDKEKEISHLKEVSLRSSEILDKKITEFSKFREDSIFKFDQLRLRLITGVFSTYAFRATSREICLVIKEFKAEYDMANKLLTFINSYADIIEETKKSIDILLNKNIPLAVQVSLKNMRSDMNISGNLIVRLRDKLKVVLDSYEKNIKFLDDNWPKFKDFVIEQALSCYLVPSNLMYHPDVWMVFEAIYKDWFHIFYHKLIQGIPDFRNEWNYLVNSFLGGIFMFLSGWFLFRKFLKNKEARRKMFTKSLFWGTLASVICVYSNLIDFYPRIYFNYFFIVIFTVTSIMYLSWGFRCTDITPEKKSPFVPMFWLFVYGIILQIMDVYLPISSILWLLGIIISILYLKKQIRKNYFAYENFLLILSFIIYICCAAIILIGLTDLSILVLLVWFVICLGIQFGLNVNASSRRIIEQFAGGSHSLLKIIIISIISPIIWLAMMVSIYYWLIAQTVGSEMLAVDLNTSIHVYGVEIHLGYIGFGLYLFFVFRSISNMTKITIRKLVSTSKIEAGAAPSISLLASYVLWCLYLIIFLKLIGMNLTNIAVVTGGLSVGLGFGLRDIVNNFLSSLIILLSHSIRHGDIIEIDGIVGKVLEITIRSTVVQTNYNAIVAIPNSDIISSKLINWTSNSPVVKKDIKIGISYDSDIEKVKYILLDLAKNTEHILNDPSPIVIFNDFADSNLSFVLSVWVDDIRIAASVTGLIREKINTQFKANNIEMAYPQLDVHLDYPKSQAKI